MNIFRKSPPKNESINAWIHRSDPTIYAFEKDAALSARMVSQYHAFVEANPSAKSLLDKRIGHLEERMGGADEWTKHAAIHLFLAFVFLGHIPVEEAYQASKSLVGRERKQLQADIAKFLGMYGSNTSAAMAHEKWQQWYANTDYRSPFPSHDPTSFGYIVHTFELGFLANNPQFLSSGGAAAMGKWDAISASYITNTSVYTYNCVGVILDVHPANLLLASDSDMMYRNNIGDASRVEQDLHDGDQIRASYAKMSPAELHGALALHTQGFADSHKNMRPPEYLAEGRGGSHTELILAGRPGVNIHSCGATREISWLGAFFTYDKTKWAERPASSSVSFGPPVPDLENYCRKWAAELATQCTNSRALELVGDVWVDPHRNYRDATAKTA